MSSRDHSCEHCGRGGMNDPADVEIAAVVAALQPILSWYQSDEAPARPVSAVVADAVADLQHDRAECLRLRADLSAVQRVVTAAEAMLDSTDWAFPGWKRDNHWYELRNALTGRETKRGGK